MAVSWLSICSLCNLLRLERAIEWSIFWWFGSISKVATASLLARNNKVPLRERKQITFKNEFNSPKQYVGISLEHPRGYGKRNLCGEYGINYFINQTKNLGDTLKLNWFANNFYLIFKYDLFYYPPRFTLCYIFINVPLLVTPFAV